LEVIEKVVDEVRETTLKEGEKS